MESMGCSMITPENRDMVDRSDLVVFCIQRGGGGAWQTMKYAKKQGKHYINLNNQMEEAE
ncbi:MAG: hypothetical protein IKA47_06550 [Oscillospiraceae bacterium]|nr:hypothetical protein [Oscillospiraceae bacterium]